MSLKTSFVNVLGSYFKMVIYKNLRDVEQIDNEFSYIGLPSAKAKVDVYKTGGILRWYKQEYIKTINLIYICNVWRDLDNEYIPLDNADCIMNLYHEYNREMNRITTEQMIIDEIKKYK